jgi:hypothetical protein
LGVFPAANERSALENIDQSIRREFGGVFLRTFSKLVSLYYCCYFLALSKAFQAEDPVGPGYFLFFSPYSEIKVKGTV